MTWAGGEGGMRAGTVWTQGAVRESGGQKMKEKNQKGVEGRGKGAGGRPAAKDRGQRTRWWTSGGLQGRELGRGAVAALGGELRELARGSGA